MDDVVPGDGGVRLRLTIGAGGAVTASMHPDHAAAHRQLVRRAVAGDYYIQTLEATPTRVTHRLLRLTRDRHRPRVAGHAVIEAAPTEAGAR